MTGTDPGALGHGTSTKVPPDPRNPVRTLSELPTGARVVVRLPNGRALADTLLTCFDLGLVAVPLHPRATDRAARDIAERVSATALVDIRGPHRTGLPDVHGPTDDLAFIMFTSGSTGPQKGVMLEAGGRYWATRPGPRRCTG